MPGRPALLTLLVACAAPPVEADAPPDVDAEPPVVEDTLPPWSIAEDIADRMPEDGLFRIDRVVDVEIDLTRAARDGLAANPRAYVPATLTMLKRTLQVGVRIKGSSTFQPLGGKPSLKVAIDHVVPGQELFGWEGFNLHNDIADASYVGDVVAHRLLTAHGVPSLRTGYARVWIDGELKGLYSLVQRKDADWIAAWFDDPTGSLYEGIGCDLGGGDGWLFGGGTDPSCWETDHVGDADSRQDLTAFVQVMADTQGPRLWEVFPVEMDEPRTVRGFAAEWVLGHWDSYTGNLNNAHLYHEPSTDRWSLSPWSLDLAFARPVGGDCHTIGVNKAHYRTATLGRRCQNHEPCNALLEGYAAEMLDVIDDFPIDPVFDDLDALLAPYVEEDPFGPGLRRWRREMACARDFLHDRRGELGL